MFARQVSLNLKPDTLKDFTKTMETHVIPMLRMQDGFRDEITLAAEGGRSAIGISLWDSADSARAYERDTFPKVQKLMDQVAEGSPRVETFDVSTSTFHQTLTPSKS